MTDFAEIHDELRSVAAGLLAKAAVDWSLLVHAGWVGLDVPEALGGAGATFAEVAVICEELGRAAATTGYLGGAVLGIGALLAVGPSASRDRLLTEVVEGHTRVALAVPGDMSPGEPEPPFGVAADGRVYGRAAFVPDAADAHRLLLPARDAAGATVLVEAGSGVAVSEQSVLDETRRLAIVVADGCEAHDIWRLDDMGALARRAALAVACDSLGVAQAMLDATVSYAGMRQQFGRPIGSFQAVKHACADMLVRVTVARQLVTGAVNDPSDETVAKAKSSATEAAVDIAGKAMQLHGGIGYTWESGIHTYLKRAALNRSLFGSPREYRSVLAARYRSVRV
ncbi:acyl-CoA/acyl-ACP dehydrogenase [Mycolicibacterium goodii]|uniref:acyl-CoA dehydrogenase family protein n=1 Tax=Mycolicibacterium goodii TaxID=134601 RepID=UPI001F03AC04|nr:acyl-CoA dehydrogenase family protein [Mycolicibacterium goodii]ULN46719.1 acyl-CoA/acyl-ACP dehydrogenase [Mycolicibacterium goodii]